MSNKHVKINHAYVLCDTITGRSASVDSKMAYALVREFFGPCSSAQIEQALMQLQDGYCISVKGGILRKVEAIAPDRKVARVRKKVMRRVNAALFPIVVRVTRKEFLALPIAVRRRAMREMAENSHAEHLQTLLDEGDDE
jgi:hypothetical protein